MVVGVLTLHLLIPGAHSLKEKRHGLRSVKDRLRSRFNVSVAEVDGMETWQRAVLGVCAVGNDRAYVEGQLDRVVAMAGVDRHVEMVACEKEFF